MFISYAKKAKKRVYKLYAHILCQQKILLIIYAYILIESYEVKILSQAKKKFNEKRERKGMPLAGNPLEPTHVLLPGSPHETATFA